MKRYSIDDIKPGDSVLLHELDYCNDHDEGAVGIVRDMEKHFDTWVTVEEILIDEGSSFDVPVFTIQGDTTNCGWSPWWIKDITSKEVKIDSRGNLI